MISVISLVPLMLIRWWVTAIDAGEITLCQILIMLREIYEVDIICRLGREGGRTLVKTISV